MRVSTEEQTTVNQEGPLRAYCERNGWGVGEIYRETISGTKSDRPELNRMLRDAARRRFDVLVFWSVDRLSRGGVFETIRTLKQLTECGVSWASHQEPFLKTTEPMLSELLLAVLAWVASFEVERRRTRIKAGQERARAAGRHIGRPARPLTALQQRRASLLRADGMSLSQIAERIGAPKTTVQRFFKNGRMDTGGDRRHILTEKGHDENKRTNHNLQ